MNKTTTPKFTPDQLQNLLTEVQDFVKTELFPLEKESFSHDWEQLLPILDKKRQLVKEKGWWIPQIPEEWGGMGLSLEEHGRLSAVLGQSPYGHYVFNCQAPDAGNMEILIEFGTSAQQEKFLKPLLAGEIRSCFAMTEPEFAGSNPIMMGSTGKREGDQYVINGHKWFTSGGHQASFSIVMCVTNPNSDSPYTRASQIIVPCDTKGFEHVRRIPVGGEKGYGWASHSEVRYHHCKVPVENLLGEEGRGFAIAQTRLGPGRIHHCMRWLGICQRAFDMMVERAATRKIRSGKVLAQQQTIQNWIAECKTEMYAARLMVLDTARKIDQKGTYEAREEISMIKFYCANVLQKVLDLSIQVHGALGVTDDIMLSYWSRHERGARIYDGADEVHKSRVAKLELKKYGVKI
jgi:acyl-CoA dehydrogenase